LRRIGQHVSGGRALRRPNFFIIGAPKCGTTSLSVWLSEHPNIFMSPIKEPHFFNTDDRQAVTTLDQYEALFCDATEEHLAVGEASVWYLSSVEAVPAIVRYQPEARFIVMVRNPLEMAPALHGEMLSSGLEYEQRFSRAWHLQDERRRGRRVPPAYRWARRRFVYGDVCSLGMQLRRLYITVSSNRVLTVNLDDICVDSRREYLKVLQFLGIPDDGRLKFPRYNPATAFRYPGLQRLVYPALELKDRLGIRIGLGLWTSVGNLMRIETPREPLTLEMRSVLKEYFSEDIALLGELLGRDLRRWLAIEQQMPITWTPDPSFISAQHALVGEHELIAFDVPARRDMGREIGWMVFTENIMVAGGASASLEEAKRAAEVAVGYDYAEEPLSEIA